MIGAIAATMGTALVLYLVMRIDQVSSPADTLATPTLRRRSHKIQHQKAA